MREEDLSHQLHRTEISFTGVAQSPPMTKGTSETKKGED
jgi:hypothetical protein